ncbi:hypothetical protein FACS189485_17830 [Spirochaetia bacterium]|nr:hypothetical protein FACS189485_17830 [Spirochaetia bacterium]
MNISPHGKKPFVLTLLHGAALFSFGICLLAVFLYLAGTGQQFMDSTQLALINLAILGGIFSALLSLYGIITDLVCLFRPHREEQPQAAYIRGIAGYFFLGLTGALIAVLGTLIAAAARGNVS